MCRFVGLAFKAAAMAALLLSVAQKVKITSSGCAPMRSATCSRAVVMTAFNFEPNLYLILTTRLRRRADHALHGSWTVRPSRR